MSNEIHFGYAAEAIRNVNPFEMDFGKQVDFLTAKKSVARLLAPDAEARAFGSDFIRWGEVGDLFDPLVELVQSKSWGDVLTTLSRVLTEGAEATVPGVDDRWAEAYVAAMNDPAFFEIAVGVLEWVFPLGTRSSAGTQVDYLAVAAQVEVLAGNKRMFSDWAQFSVLVYQIVLLVRQIIASQVA